MLLRGLVDKVGKLEGKMAGLDVAMAKLMGAMHMDNCEERVSAAELLHTHLDWFHVQ